MQQNNLSKWLERLQQESWNLELLISGFSIFLLFQVGGIIDEINETLIIDFMASSQLFGFVVFFLKVAQTAAIVLLINLVVHVVLRGFWIGTIGLRSVQEKINFEGMSYSTFFKEKLKRKVAGLDQLVVRLDTICSVIFSFTFLIIFMLISFFMFSILFVLLAFLFTGMASLASGTPEDIIEIVYVILISILLLSALIYFIDTLSLGFFKRYKWLSKIYYPIYYFMGFVTLAFVYRSIYYSLISRFSKNKIRLLLIPYLFAISLFPFFGFNYYIFYPDNFTETQLESNVYDDIRKSDIRISKASIPSQMIENQWLPLFIRYDINLNEDILKLCTEYEPSKKGGFQSGVSFSGGGNFQISTPSVEEKDSEKLLNCLSQFYTIYLNDSLQTQKDFYHYMHPNKNEKGIYTVLNIADLSPGKNVLQIKTKRFIDSDEWQEQKYISIPFWKQ